MFTISWLLIITIAAAAFAVVDGIRRVRGHRSNSILAIAELVFAVLMLISIFVALPAPFTTFVFAIALEVVLVLLLIIRATARNRSTTTLTLVALILNTVVVLIAAGWLSIPGLA